jgi:hypothetical protein
VGRDLWSPHATGRGYFPFPIRGSISSSRLSCFFVFGFGIAATLWNISRRRQTSSPFPCRSTKGRLIRKPGGRPVGKRPPLRRRKCPGIRGGPPGHGGKGARPWETRVSASLLPGADGGDGVGSRPRRNHGGIHRREAPARADRVL